MDGEPHATRLPPSSTTASAPGGRKPPNCGEKQGEDGAGGLAPDIPSPLWAPGPLLASGQRRDRRACANTEEPLVALPNTSPHDDKDLQVRSFTCLKAPALSGDVVPFPPQTPSASSPCIPTSPCRGSRGSPVPGDTPGVPSSPRVTAWVASATPLPPGRRTMTWPRSCSSAPRPRGMLALCQDRHAAFANTACHLSPPGTAVRCPRPRQRLQVAF